MAEEQRQTEDKENPIIPQIKETLEKLAVFIRKDGGDIKFQGFDPKEGIVYVSLTGACQGCMYIDQTMSLGVEAILQEEVPGVNAVKVVDDSGQVIETQGF
jgi:Fe-S cluster biogenesis protein NfuA